MSYRKIGGIHWFKLGRLRISFCLVKAKPMIDIPAMLRLPNIANGPQI